MSPHRARSALWLVVAAPPPEAEPEPEARQLPPLPAGPLATARLALAIHAARSLDRRYRLPYEQAVNGLLTFEEADEMIVLLYLHDLAEGRTR